MYNIKVSNYKLLLRFAKSTLGAGLLEDRFVRNSERELKQLLQEVFFERTEVQVSAVQLLELLEDSQGSRHTARGLSVAELLAAVGCMASDEAVVDTTSEGRLARAQLEARSQRGAQSHMAKAVNP